MALLVQKLPVQLDPDATREQQVGVVALHAGAGREEVQALAAKDSFITKSWRKEAEQRRSRRALALTVTIRVSKC